LTGKPGSGKTTAIKKIVSLLTDGAGGFYTREVRSKDKRVGFEIVTLTGRVKMLAQKSHIPSSPHSVLFRDYWVDTEALDSLAIPAILEAMNENKIIVIDEIGPMEVLSSTFRETVMRIVNGPNTTAVCTIVERPDAFANVVKSHPRVELVTLRPDNRDDLPYEIYRYLVMNQGEII
jgi:nucleoside-triphosphatase